jgi:hypothetical protein
MPGKGSPHEVVSQYRKPHEFGLGMRVTVPTYFEVTVHVDPLT